MRRLHFKSDDDANFNDLGDVAGHAVDYLAGSKGGQKILGQLAMLSVMIAGVFAVVWLLVVLFSKIARYLSSIGPVGIGIVLVLVGLLLFWGAITLINGSRSGRSEIFIGLVTVLLSVAMIAGGLVPLITRLNAALFGG